MNDDRQRYAIHAAVFAALANPTRHELMHHLCDAPRTPSELAELLEVSRPNVSQHLAILQRDGLVRRYARGRTRALGGRRTRACAEACELIDEILGPELASRARRSTRLDRTRRTLPRENHA